MFIRKSNMKGIQWKCIVLFLFHYLIHMSNAQDYGDPVPTTPPSATAVSNKDIDACNGIFISYVNQGREKIYPFVRNVSAQAWAFEAAIEIMNTGDQELKSWQVSVGFQYHELLVSADGAIVLDADEFPFRVGNNGTVFAGAGMTDLRTAIDTANDESQMQAQINLKGTMFGGDAKSNPMPKTLKLANFGYKCPAATRTGTYMHVCCVKDPKMKEKKILTKFFPRRYGDLTFTYDVLKSYDNKYLAQVTMDNNHPLGRLDQWNLTWEWMRNEFIYSMKGAYTHKMDPSECIYGPQGRYYKDFDFSGVMNCQKKPVISDLPHEKENDDKVGKLPYCCKDGVLLPKLMNETQSKALFQLEVFKLPPDLNRTALNPPQNWKIEGRLNPSYKCSPPIRVDPSVFPEPTGLPATTSAITSWQVSCNMTQPKPKQSKCCVSFSAYYADEAIPCPTCACGCEDNTRCNKTGTALIVPPDALLVPFENRTRRTIAFARIKKRPLPRQLPCPDNCGVSINWHVESDYADGWTARITLFNWEEQAFANWFSAVNLKHASRGFQKAYSFNGTLLPDKNNTIFLQGLKGLNYLIGEINGTHPERGDPRVPGKQQTVISFTKEGMQDLRIPKGDGFPSKFIFNGEECALPHYLPESGARQSSVGMLLAILLAVLTLLFLTEHLN